MKKLILLCSTAVVFPTAAFAQSTGTTDFEKEVIVVTGSRTQDVGGVQAPDSPKAKAVLTQEMISRSGPGQTVLDTINVIPSVSFQNNDAYGNAGGTLSVRGFDSTRVSYTLDGIQLNDSGNYNIYSNFSIDPELIEQVNVSLGTTDVDSPTASAAGGTINQRTRIPGKELGGRFSASIGQFDYRRFFGMLDTGEFTSFGTRAFVAASTSKYDNPFNGYGKLDRQQYNAKIYQPIGTNGDFVSIAGRYNQDRNNFFGSVALRNDRAVPSGFPQSKDDREYEVGGCEIDAPQAGTQDQTNTCGSEFDRRYNPSNSVNIRGNSRFTITDGLVLTIDPSYQYTKANGGGTVVGREGVRIIDGVEYTGFIGGNYYFGRDLNGDGDVLDTCRIGATAGQACSSTASASNQPFGGVRLLAPSQTRTRRYAAIAGLRYDINDHHTVRATFTHDYSNHRQTGEVGFLKPNGEPVDVFPVNDPITDKNGNVVQKRDRQSYAILNQVAGEYRGEFGGLTVNVGARLPFFKRDLQNNCFTTSAGGFVDCFGGDEDLEEAYADEFPNLQGPQHRVLKYNKLLPNIGAVYDFTPNISAFISYSKGISVPSTDNLYNAFFFPADAEEAKPNPEITDTFDGGVRYRSSKIQAQLGVWYTKFSNRLASAYDPELDATVYRNLGRVNKWGIDGSIAYSPAKELTIYAFGSWNKSKIKDDVQVGQLPLVDPLDLDGPRKTCDDPTLTTAEKRKSCAYTAGNRESGMPIYTYGFSGVGTLGPIDLGITAKRTGPRYVFDTNVPVVSGSLAGTLTEIYPAKAPAYWLVNLDARLNMGYFAQNLSKTYLQLNVYNLFDKLYVGGFGGGLTQALNTGGTAYSDPPFVQIGAPRTVSLTVNVGF